MIIILILAAVGLDQWTKYLAVEHLMGEASYPFWQDVLHFTYVENRGAAFGMLADHRWVFMIFSVAAIGILLFWLWKEKPQSIWVRMAAAFIVGGGIGNMIDRVRLGYVVDFIDVRLIDFYVFNVADSFVCVGCALFLLWAVFSEIGAKKKPAEAAAEAPETADEEQQ
ncbi:MAG: signal peptidase II [Ruminococcaceae bacterium]|nr:signal peptidase II [Oscillospiraceae bacterium]